MPTLPEVQAALRDVVFSDAAGAEALVRSDGLAAARRLAIHRNTAFATLTEALAATYPTVRALVGGDFFDALARAYLTARPPRTRCLIDLGGNLGDFVDGFEPVRGLPYLGDAARLDWAWHRAFHAADALSVAADALAGVTDDAGSLRLFLHPSTRLVRSRYPVGRIRRAARSAVASREPIRLDGDGARLLLVRPHLEVTMRDLDAGTHAFAAALMRGETLNDACRAGAETTARFEPGPALAALFDAGAVTGFLHGAEPDTTLQERRP